MRKNLLILVASLLALGASAAVNDDCAVWRFTKNRESKGVKNFIESGLYNAAIANKSATLSFRHKNKVVNGELLDAKGNPSALLTKGDYWLFELPVTKVEAGTVVDFVLPFASEDKSVASFVFEYRDGKKWLPVIAVDDSGNNVTSTPNVKHHRRLWHSVRLTNPIENGAVAFRLRRVEKEPAVATITLTSSRGLQPQVYVYDTAVPRDTTKLLFIGNSYTFYHNYPMIFKQMAWREGHFADCNIFVSGGYTMKAHLANKYSLEQIDKGGYDFVMLQDQSIQCTVNGTADDYGCAKQVGLMVNRVRKSSPNANIHLEITWGRRYGNNNFGKYAPLLEKYPEFYASYDAMQNRLIEIVSDEAKQSNIGTTPLGYAWQIVMHERPELNLYHTDNHHQSYAGSYLAAAVAYLTVYKQPFAQNPYNGLLKASTAAYLRSVAERVVLKGEKWVEK